MKPKTEALEKRWLALSPIERLLLVGIVGVLVGLLAAQFATIQARGRDKERKRDIKAIQLEVGKYYALRGKYPVDLSNLKDLADDACRDPLGDGSCDKPDYGYKAFKAKTDIDVNGKADCTNKAKSACERYIIYTEQMERTGNPYSVKSF